jgi:hypothetical protein
VIGLDQFGPDAPHFEYTLRVNVLEPEILSFEISKRFSEMARLDLSLSSLTKFLPFFPPRGAQRILTNSHAQERMKLLNTYFHIICQMEEVLHCHEFLSFFGLDKNMDQSPSLVAEIRPSDASTEGLYITSLNVSEEFLFLGYGKPPSVTSKAMELVSSWFSSDSQSANVIQGQLQIWYRLPNSYLFERRSVYSLPSAVTTAKVCDKLRTINFGTSDGRVGSTAFPTTHHEEEGIVCYLGGLIHGSAVTAIEHDSNNYIFTGGDDGLLQWYSLDERIVKGRILSNAEAASITRICCGAGIIFVGLSTGVINIFDSDGLRLITLLQGPFSRIVNLSLLDDTVLVAAHAGSMLDNAEGFNTVQFWDVSEVARRGTSKLAHWGPSAAPIVGASVLTDNRVAVACTNGALNVFTHSRTEMTHRAKYIFNAQTNYVRENCVTSHGDCLYVAGESVHIWKLPPHSLDAIAVLDISTPSLCQAVSRTPAEPVRKLATSRQHSYLKPTDDDEDLHSWARP